MSKRRLLAHTRKELAQMAKKRAIPGWRAMTKDHLADALHALDSRRPRKRTNRSTPVKKARTAAHVTRDDTASPEFLAERSKYDVGVPTRQLSRRTSHDLPNGYHKDRVVVMVRDPYWLHAYWEITHSTAERAQSALAQDWHGSRPILRLVEIGGEEAASGSESAVRDIEIHGGCRNWYIDVPNPPRTYRVDIGYLTRTGRFYVLARSNVVRTPRPGASDVIDENWTDVQQNFEKIFAMSGGLEPGVSSAELRQLFEERLRRPMSSPSMSSLGSGVLAKIRPRKFFFELDAELIVYGSTEPDAKVTLQGEPVALRPDGTFTMRYSLPDRRQILPAVATSADGTEERTIVLAVERNTRALPPVVHDLNEPPPG